MKLTPPDSGHSPGDAPKDPLAPDIARAARYLREAGALIIAAGAGMGVDSGLPDFRGTDGFWRAYPAIARRGLRFEAMAQPRWFAEDPALAWAFYGHRMNLYRATVPHAGFGQLLELGTRLPHGAFVFTSNVDGHFQKAGFPEDRIIECHGSIHHFQCQAPCTKDIWDAAGETVIVNETTFLAEPPLPACRHCGGLARPNVLMFDDRLWLSQRTDAQAARWEPWMRAVAADNAPLVLVEIGAGTAVPSVRLWTEYVARLNGGRLIRINTREATVPRGQIGLPLGGAEGIRRLLNAL